MSHLFGVAATAMRRIVERLTTSSPTATGSRKRRHPDSYQPAPAAQQVRAAWIPRMAPAPASNPLCFLFCRAPVWHRHGQPMEGQHPVEGRRAQSSGGERPTAASPTPRGAGRQARRVAVAAATAPRHRSLTPPTAISVPAVSKTRRRRRRAPRGSLRRYGHQHGCSSGRRRRSCTRRRDR